MTRDEAKIKVSKELQVVFASKDMYLTDKVIDMVFDHVEPELDLVYRKGVIDGFAESDEGWNWEHPMCHGQNTGSEYSEMIDKLCHHWRIK